MHHELINVSEHFVLTVAQGQSGFNLGKLSKSRNSTSLIQCMYTSCLKEMSALLSKRVSITKSSPNSAAMISRDFPSCTSQQFYISDAKLMSITTSLIHVHGLLSIVSNFKLDQCQLESTDTAAIDLLYTCSTCVESKHAYGMY